MSNYTFEGWGLLAIFSALTISSWLLLGKIIVDTFVRFDLSRKRQQYRKWGAEEDIFWPTSLLWFIAGAIGVLATAAYMSYIFLLFISLQFTGETKLDFHSSVFERGISSIILVILIGGLIRSINAVGVAEKVNALEKLPSVFKDNFTRSELLSMYESLRHAPPLFWEEYRTLSDEEVNEATNRKYRERAAPFMESKLHAHNRWILSWTAITVILAIVVALANFLFK